MTLTIGSLCSGMGGLDMGVQQVLDAEVAWHCEYAAAPSKILAHHWPEIPNHHDLTTTDWAAVEPVDILTAGYPCQPFSGNGSRGGQDDPRHLWPAVFRAIRQLRPRYIFLENVEDHLSLGFGAVLGDLASAGFDAEWCVLRASDVGAPHGRPRLFLVATNSGSFFHAATQSKRLAGKVRTQPAPPSAERLNGPGAGHDADQDSVDEGCVSSSFKDYGPAVERWERIINRRAPGPLVNRQGAPDINPRFVEWAMGLPHGWVTDVPGISVSDQFKALGNGVVPQQAAAAYAALLGPLAVAA